MVEMDEEILSGIPLLKSISSFFPKKILFGVGCFDKVGEEAKKLGATKALLVVDPVVAKFGIVDRAKRSLEQQKISVNVFDRVEPEPHIEIVHEATPIVRKEKCDIIIGVGGGSALDVAKALSVMAANPGSMEDYIGFEKIKCRSKLILSPTTAGTGSEVSAFIVLTVKGVEKALTFSSEVPPDVAIVDPMLTVTMPPKVTAGTGFDALSHAIESILSVDSNDYTETFAFKAVELIGKYFRMAYHQGWNIEARRGMSLAALLAGFAFSVTGCVIGHGAAMRLGERFHIPHGEACALCLPYTMEFNIPVAAEKLAKVAQALGVSTVGLSNEEAALKASKFVKALAEEFGLKTSLKDYGIKREDLETLVNDFLERSTAEIKWNPRKITEENLTKFYEKLWEGNI
ncbi:MAG: iron-containing alcohol dehydrogenase [Candidatus Bathyarchaeia archaeon]